MSWRENLEQGVKGNRLPFQMVDVEAALKELQRLRNHHEFWCKAAGILDDVFMGPNATLPNFVPLGESMIEGVPKLAAAYKEQVRVNGNLRHACESKDSDHAKLCDLLAKQDAEIKTLRIKLDKQRDAVQAYENEIVHDLRMEINSLKIQLAASREECRNLESEASSRIANLYRQIDELRRKCSTLPRHDSQPTVKGSPFTFVDPDGDVLEVGMNHSFGYPSITLHTFDGRDPDGAQGVRMKVPDARTLVAALSSAIDLASRQVEETCRRSEPEPTSFVVFVHGGRTSTPE